MNCSMFILPLSAMAAYDLPAPRWSQFTTVKNFSRRLVLRRFDVSCDVPGPPCRNRMTGLSVFSDRSRTHWPLPPMVTFSSTAMLLAGSAFPFRRIRGVPAGMRKRRTTRATTTMARISTAVRLLFFSYKATFCKGTREMSTGRPGRRARQPRAFDGADEKRRSLAARCTAAIAS